MEVLGWRPDEIVGRRSTEFIHPEDQTSAVLAWFNMVGSPGSTGVWRGRYRSTDGQWKWVESVNVNRLDDPVNPVVQSTIKLVAVDEANIEEELRIRKQLLNRLSDALPVGLLQIDSERRVTFTNDRLHSILGTGPLLEAAIADVLAGHAVNESELRLAPQDGARQSDSRVCVMSLRALNDRQGAVSGVIACVTDITDQVQLRRELELRATTDDLTRCLNRAATLEIVEAMLAPDRVSSGLAVVFIDLDRFKDINDRFGHGAGDHVLKVAAARLLTAMRQGDVSGRVGGDEFLVVCRHVPSAATALELGERLANALTANVDLGNGTIGLRASVGVAWTAQSLDPDVFVARADRAMYESKRDGQSTARLVAVTHQGLALTAPHHATPSDRIAS